MDDQLTDEQPGHTEEFDPLVGATIGSYKILRVLGKGGMGAVYLAEHPIINSQVAIKFLHQKYAADKKVIDRFFNEARAVNVIGHPNILKILDLNVTPDQRHYFVMEFLHGRALTQVIRPGGVGLDLAGPILLQCCAALEAAHEHGIIHRDLKPDNIYLVSHLGRANFVKIVDFGIAKLTDLGELSSGRTQTGVVMGTPAYMSPEQATGEGQIDGRSDIYSLGVIMFQLATGRLPFEDTTFGNLLISHVQKKPPAPRSIAAATPEPWERLILSTLEKDPAARPQSMAVLQEALHDCLETLGISPELPLDPGPADGSGAPRLPSDPGKRRTPGYISAPRVTPPGRKPSRPSIPPTQPNAAKKRADTGPRLPPARTETKRRTVVIAGVSALAVVALGALGLFAAGVFDEPAGRENRQRAQTAPAAAPADAPEAPRSAEREAAATPAAEKPAEATVPTPPPAAAPRRVAAALASAAPPAVRLAIVSDPPGAEVIARWDGGRKKGKAPFQFDAPKGARIKLAFSLKGYSPSEEEIVADAPRTVTSELVQLLGD